MDSVQNIHAPPKVMEAIAQASQKTGVDFSYLVQQAKAESNLNPSARAKTSSATGLYQFIDGTWLDMVERHGEAYGLKTKGKSKAELLNMRKDPKAASFMAAAFASDNEKFLNNHWGGNVGKTELYFAHFLGAGGASSFLKARDDNPLRPAADLFPRLRAPTGMCFMIERLEKHGLWSRFTSFLIRNFRIIKVVLRSLKHLYRLKNQL